MIGAVVPEDERDTATEEPLRGEPGIVEGEEEKNNKPSFGCDSDALVASGPEVVFTDTIAGTVVLAVSIGSSPVEVAPVVGVERASGNSVEGECGGEPSGEAWAGVGTGVGVGDDGTDADGEGERVAVGVGCTVTVLPLGADTEDTLNSGSEAGADVGVGTVVDAFDERKVVKGVVEEREVLGDGAGVDGAEGGICARKGRIL